jgi:hypothetical protein
MERRSLLVDLVPKALGLARVATESRALLLLAIFKTAPASLYARRIAFLSIALALFLWLPLLPVLLHLVPSTHDDEGAAFRAMSALLSLPTTGGCLLAWGLLKLSSPAPHEGSDDEWVPVGRKP